MIMLLNPAQSKMAAGEAGVEQELNRRLEVVCGALWEWRLTDYLELVAKDWFFSCRCQQGTLTMKPVPRLFCMKKITLLETL